MRARKPAGMGTYTDRLRGALVVSPDQAPVGGLGAPVTAAAAAAAGAAAVAGRRDKRRAGPRHSCTPPAVPSNHLREGHFGEISEGLAAESQLLDRLLHLLSPFVRDAGHLEMGAARAKKAGNCDPVRRATFKEAMVA